MSDEKVSNIEKNLEKATNKMESLADSVLELTITIKDLIKQREKDEAWKNKTDDRISRLETLEAVRNDRDQTFIWIKRAVVTTLVGAVMALILYKAK